MRIAVIDRAPDGRSLAIGIDPAGTELGQLLVVSTDGTVTRRMWPPSGQEGGRADQPALRLATWAADSRSLIARGGGAPNPLQFWWIAGDGPRRRPLVEFDGLVPAGLRVHPDGRRVLFGATAAGGTATAAPTEVWVWSGLLPSSGK